MSKLFVVAKSGAGAQIVGPFLDIASAAEYMGENKMLGFSILPMESPIPNERTFTPANVDVFLDRLFTVTPTIKKIYAVKEVRNFFNCGLREAKDACELYWDSKHPNSPWEL